MISGEIDRRPGDARGAADVVAEWISPVDQDEVAVHRGLSPSRHRKEGTGQFAGTAEGCCRDKLDLSPFHTQEK